MKMEKRDLTVKPILEKSMNPIRILFFATLRDRAGKKMMEMEISPEMTIRELKVKLTQDHPNLTESMKSVLITINREYAMDDSIVPAGAEIAMFPPVSGG